jgi:hypothetical protein
MSTIIYNGTFAVADTTANATAGSTATSIKGLWDAVTVGTQGAWIDSSGSSNFVSSNRGVVSNLFTNAATKRPAGDAARDQQIQVILSASGNQSNCILDLKLRDSSSTAATSGPCYTCEIGYAGSCKFCNDSLTQIGATQTLTGAIDPAQTCTVTFKAVGTTSVVLTLTVVQNGATLGSFTVTDSSPSVALQGSGVAGIAHASQNIYFDQVVITNITTTSISLSPNTGTTGTSGTVAVTGTGTSFSGSPFSLTGGTGASITSQSVSSATAASINVNYGSATGTLTVSDGAGDTANITVSAPSALAPGVVSLTSATTTTISLTSTSPTGGTAPITQQWYRGTTSDFTPGTGNLLAGKTSLTLTDTPPTSGVYFYALKFTDSAGSPATVYATPSGAAFVYVAGAVGTPYPASTWATPISVYEIGDSVTYYGANYSSYAQNIIKFAAGNPRAVTYTTNGISGTATMDWLPAGNPRSTNAGNIDPAVTAAIAANATHISIRLGANNLKTSFNSTAGPLTPAATWLSDIVAIGTYIRAAFVTAGKTAPSILVHAPSYIVPNVLQFSGQVTQWDDNSDAMNLAYNAIVGAGGIGTGFYPGDTASYHYFANNPGLMDYAGVHHNTQGYQDHNSNVGSAFVAAFLSSGGTGGIVNPLCNNVIQG